jgi:hypothetical protein
MCIGPLMACVMFGGLQCPKFAAAMGFLTAIGRIMYAVGYTTNRGADGRIIGTSIALLGYLGAVGATVYTSFKIGSN